MSFNRAKNEYFFPSKVFRCACLGTIIQKCFDEGIYAMVDIADELSRYCFDDDFNKVFVIKCGKQSKDYFYL